MALLAWLNKGDEGKEMLKLTSQLRVGYELVSRVSGEREIQAAEVMNGKEPKYVSLSINFESKILNSKMIMTITIMMMKWIVDETWLTD